MRDMPRSQVKPALMLREYCRNAVACALRPRGPGGNALPVTNGPAGRGGSDAAPSPAVRYHDRLLAATGADALSTEHRPKVAEVSRLAFPALVARKVPRMEMKTNPKVDLQKKNEN